MAEIEPPGLTGSVSYTGPWGEEAGPSTGTKPSTTSPITSSGSFNINTFMSDIRGRGIVKSNSFMVNIIPPKVISSQWPDTRRIIIRCDSASLPSVNFQMYDIYKHGYGPQETSPHNVQFEPINLTFLLDGEGEIYNFWYSWVNSIYNFNRSQGLNTKVAGSYAYEMAYKDDYAAEIRVLVYNEAADGIIQASMLKAFPMGIAGVDLNWSNNDTPVHLNIPISYRDYYAQVIKGGDLHDTVQNFLNPPASSITTRDQYRIFGLNFPANKVENILSDILLR